jgi:ketosteroid isomerase-like protein
MPDPSTCGQGLAEHSRLPLVLAELFDHSADNLEVHLDTLDLTDEHALTERDVWIRVAEQHRSIAAQLRATGELMAEHRHLPMARHDAEALSSTRVVGAFESFVADEEAVVELLTDWLERDRAMLRDVPRAELILRSAYRAFNARDVEAAIELMHPDVDWPNAWEGGRVVGRAAVRDYWNRQFAAISSKVEPTGFTEEPDGSVTVDVHQVVHDARTGELVSDSNLRHRYRLADGLVVRMDVLEAPRGRSMS